MLCVPSVVALVAHVFFFYCYGDLRDLHSFPTRRSSDLRDQGVTAAREVHRRQLRPVDGAGGDRSEEHTSELQLPYDLVCRLLLEKKKMILPSLSKSTRINSHRRCASRCLA